MPESEYQIGNDGFFRFPIPERFFNPKIGRDITAGIEYLQSGPYGVIAMCLLADIDEKDVRRVLFSGATQLSGELLYMAEEVKDRFIYNLARIVSGAVGIPVSSRSQHRTMENIMTGTVHGITDGNFKMTNVSIPRSTDRLSGEYESRQVKAQNEYDLLIINICGHLGVVNPILQGLYTHKELFVNQPSAFLMQMSPDIDRAIAKMDFGIG